MRAKEHRPRHCIDLADPDPGDRERRIRDLQDHYGRLGAVGPSQVPAMGLQPRPVLCRCGCPGWKSRDAAAKALGVSVTTVAKRIVSGQPIGRHTLQNGRRPQRA